MKIEKNIIAIGGAILLLIGFVGGTYRQKLYISKNVDNQTKEQQTTEDATSPYVGQEVRGIKSLSQDEVEGLLAGEGTPFGGMAKPAELNGYPGPRHVLDMADELDLSESQHSQIKQIYEEMRDEAVSLGKMIIEKEEQLDEAFTNKTVTEQQLGQIIRDSADIYADLRFVHLKYHLLMVDILNEDQVEKYNELRGYTSSINPCENIPEGHDPELWKMHNGCE